MVDDFFDAEHHVRSDQKTLQAVLELLKQAVLFVRKNCQDQWADLKV